MHALRRRPLALLAIPLLVAACQAPPEDAGPTPRDVATATREPSPAPRAMPDLMGLPVAEALRRIGELALGTDWGRPVVVRCGVRPRTVVRQHPDPGAPLEHGVTVRIRTAALDLEEFRGPCEPVDGDLGPVSGPDAAVARDFYRFAADPTLGGPFAEGDVRIGIEDRPTVSVAVAPASLAAWEIRGTYAERSGPLSALDVVAGSGGYYELHRGVVPTCPTTDDARPPELAGLRAMSLTAPADTTSSCSEWWAVTLFVDGQDLIRGVTLRLGSP